jgi:hypothetical protein
MMLVDIFFRMLVDIFGPKTFQHPSIDHRLAGPQKYRSSARQHAP